MKTISGIQGRITRMPTLVLQIIWLSILGYSPGMSAQKVIYLYPETIRLVAQVDEAAKSVTQQGEKAFDYFMRDGSRWRSGGRCTFAIDLDGNVFAHEDTAMVGKNMIDLTDPNGKPIIQWFIRKALGFSQSGWTHFLWIKSGDSIPSWKTTYVKLTKAPSGKVYVVGSGRYNIRMEKAFAVDAVNDATYLIRVEGESAFEKLKDLTSEFVFKDSYIFVLDTSYTLLVNAPFHDLEGKNLYDMQDVNGKYFFREFVQVAEEDGSGWVFYKWPKPGETKPSNKCSYIKKIATRGKIYIVGTGIYHD
ncbi:cache domain-containing protein [Bacteroidota bacterium]